MRRFIKGAGLKESLLSLHIEERVQCVTCDTCSQNIFTLGCASNHMRNTTGNSKGGLSAVSKLQRCYYAPHSGEDVRPHSSSLTTVIKPTFKNQTWKSTQYPLKQQQCLNTSLSLPLYFACTQLRDNLSRWSQGWAYLQAFRIAFLTGGNLQLNLEDG